MTESPSTPEDAATRHDPGGRVRLRLPAGVTGGAEFSACGRYRPTLWRARKGSIPETPFALWIGMNPSTAEADVDDPTIRREMTYTFERLGLSRMQKCNVMDYRATNPSVLLGLSPEERSSGLNLPAIRHFILTASVVIAAWGTLPNGLRRHAEDVERLVLRLGGELKCLGFTKDGSPRHPLYVRGDAELAPYPRRESAQ